MMKLIKLPSCAFVLFVLIACTDDERTANLQPAPRPINLVTVEAASNQFHTAFPVVIEAAQTSDLTFQLGGLLQELPVIEGQNVKQGDLIARLDARDYENQLASAEARYKNARAEYERALRLSAQNTIAEKVVDDRQAQKEIAEAALASARKALADTELRAPFDGQIASISVENFQSVRPQQRIVTLQSMGKAEAVADLPARLLALGNQIDPQNVQVTLDVDRETKIPAVLKEFSGQADQATQTYRARFSFTPPDLLIVLPGMTGTVEADIVYLGEEIDFGLAVPLGSILAEGDDLFVWVVDPQSMTVSKRGIEIGQDRFGDAVPVTAGLESGEIVAGAGAAYLHEGMQVRAWTH